MKVARASSGRAAAARSGDRRCRSGELMGRLRYFAAGRPARKTVRTVRTGFRAFNGWEGVVWPPSLRVSTLDFLATSSPAPSRPYHVLRHRDFRLLWGSQLVSLTGRQMAVVERQRD